MIAALPPKPKWLWIVVLVKGFTWISLLWLFALGFLAPTGITVPWDLYLVLFGPVTSFALAALVGFVICRMKGAFISWAYAATSIGVLVVIVYMTWFVLRLRWFQIFH